MPVKFYSEEEYSALSKRSSVLSEVIKDISRRAESQSRKERDKDESLKGCYAYISNSTGGIIESLQIAYDLIKKRGLKNKSSQFGWYEPNISFLDAGCGIGITLLIARSIGFKKVRGIEIDKKLVDRAGRDFLHLANSPKEIYNPYIYNQDIRTFRSYKAYDVIYYYVPMCNGREEVKFEEKVENESKKGAIILAFQKASRRIEKDKRFKRIEEKGAFNGSVMWEKVAI